MGNTYFEAPETMKKLPTTRAAYSDRTAWIMAEMSALAYLRFEGERKSLISEIKIITDTIKKISRAKKRPDIESEIDRIEERLKEYIDGKLGSDDEQPNGGREELENSLRVAGFDLVQTFDKGDTQAFLAKRDADNVAVLAFRGTEANSWKDIKSDLDARFYKAKDGTRVHSGFSGAFKHVENEVREALKKMENYSLYITGHSLGGALAIIASKKFERDTLAACYTFGNPRVGGEEFGEQIKVPVYRVVNAVDGVPRVPPGRGLSILVWLASKVSKRLANGLEKFSGYIHYGDMRYLTACDNDIQRVQLLQNPSGIFKVGRLIARVSSCGFLVMGKDHKIDQYRDKLKQYAQERNKPDS